MANLRIRGAVRADLARLTEIYNHYVRTTAITFDLEPLTVERRAHWFDGHAETGRHRLLVALESDQPVGYATTSKFRDRAAYDTTVESSIYCAPEATGRGIGTALYEELFSVIAGEDINRIVAGITLPNEASVALHRHFGFTRVALFTENGRKFGRYWDVAWFERPLVRTTQ
ncbi:MAG TPA: GNAT family N-acetyltransferase [Candidatus Binataceae bacterium]|nr:GNAT family N-acetyltransferase [Candidatus Binataceae bacterium]